MIWLRVNIFSWFQLKTRKFLIFFSAKWDFEMCGNCVECWLTLCKCCWNFYASKIFCILSLFATVSSSVLVWHPSNHHTRCHWCCRVVVKKKVKLNRLLPPHTTLLNQMNVVVALYFHLIIITTNKHEKYLNREQVKEWKITHFYTFY
jgi:hypothetical protein